MATVENIAVIVLAALALAFFIVVFVDLAREHRKAGKRDDRIAEEATAIVAALCAYEQIREAQEKSGKKEVNDEEDKAL